VPSNKIAVDLNWLSAVNTNVIIWQPNYSQSEMAREVDNTWLLWQPCLKINCVFILSMYLPENISDKLSHEGPPICSSANLVAFIGHIFIHRENQGLIW